MVDIKNTVIGLASLFAVNALTGCGTDDKPADASAQPKTEQEAAKKSKNALYANTLFPGKDKSARGAGIINRDGDDNTVYELNAFKLDSARGLVILNGRDIYQVDPADNQVGGYWMQLQQEMDQKHNLLRITGVAVSAIEDENQDGYISVDDLAKDATGWKDHEFTEYRLKGRPEFDTHNRSKVWRVSPVPVLPQ